MNLEAPARLEPRSTRKREGWGDIIRNSAKPGVARQWTILCFSVTGTIIAVLFVLLFVEIPAGEFISKHSGLTPGNKPVESDEPTPATNVSTWLGGSSRTVIPSACHSHNDYFRKTPLFTALTAGCTGIEADVWLSDDGKDLLVGHSRTSLRSTKTLRSMYIEPLLGILNGRNPTWAANSVYDRAQGIFATQTNTTVVLMIDVKEKPTAVWPLLIQQLEPLRQRRFLTRYEEVYSGGFVERQTLWPAPLIVVGSGELSLTSLVETYPNSTYHDTFLDAPLQTLPDVNRFWSGNASTYPVLSWGRTLYRPEDSYYSSVSFKQTIGSVMLGFSASQLNKLRTQIHTAQKSGLVSRYWDTPSWPINYRDYIWKVLTREGVGVLNVDDVKAATRGMWIEGYLKSVYLIIGTSLYLTIVSIVIWVTGLYVLRRSLDS
ncbi:hypothetical protein E0Z10_g3204 [Xylaria hypoxylon]|uniref:Altered inheritance of mitochondria protein 6 n=1 Tax=Xylaria hypoxylon TaxID=37992 RepID=A0A4Z0YNR5_9PEZI|nr:hypothetical protein E0Z10_g3204 [Xylaria hypoxylon]